MFIIEAVQKPVVGSKSNVITVRFVVLRVSGLFVDIYFYFPGLGG